MGQPESLRDFSEDMKYEVIDIPHTENSVFLSETKFVESDWIVCIDGVNKIATEYNRKTGEYRTYDFNKAMKELFS